MRINQLVNQTHSPGGLGSQVARAKHQLHGVGCTCLLNTTSTATEARVDSELYLGKAETGTFNIAGNAVVKAK